MNKKIYIWSAGPDNLRGGPEVLCLLCHILRTNGADAKMFNLSYEKNCIPSEFLLNYDLSVAENDEVLNARGATIVLPELLIQQDESNLRHLLDTFAGNDIMIWLLSTGFTGMIDTTWKNIFDVLKFYGKIIYLCESRLAWDLLDFYGIKDRKFMLQHGTHPTFKSLPSTSEKKNVILYNGYKDRTKFIVDNYIAPNIGDGVEVVGILPGKRLDREKMCEMMDAAKCYIDFCGFMGREMIPREAALRDCVLLLGNEGCASYFEDYPLPSWYKISDISDIGLILSKIRTIIDNYQNCIYDMKFMKNKCMYEYDMFTCEVKKIFGI